MEAKKIIITGGATRIGAAIARSLAEDATDITIHYNTYISKAKKIKKELDEFGIKIHLLKCDAQKEFTFLDAKAASEAEKIIEVPT